MPLGDADSRLTLPQLRDSLRRVERRVEQLASSARLLRNGTFAPGTIPADALIEPTAPGLVALQSTGFAVGAAIDGGATVLVGSIEVPPLVTGCVVSLTGRVYAVNSTAGLDYLTARVMIATTASTGLPRPVAAGGGDFNVAPAAAILEGLTPGGTFSVAVWATAQVAAWAAAEGNTADLTGSLGWFS